MNRLACLPHLRIYFLLTSFQAGDAIHRQSSLNSCKVQLAFLTTSYLHLSKVVCQCIFSLHRSIQWSKQHPRSVCSELFVDHSIMGIYSTQDSGACRRTAREILPALRRSLHSCLRPCLQLQIVLDSSTCCDPSCWSLFIPPSVSSFPCKLSYHVCTCCQPYQNANGRISC